MARQLIQLLLTLATAVLIISSADAANCTKFDLCDSGFRGGAVTTEDLTSKCHCVPFDSVICTNYNYTVVPNYRGYRDLEDTEEELQSFLQLINTDCSKHLATFLCFYYYPVCDPVSGQHSPIPCRDFCIAVKKECKGMIKNLKWPRYLKCKKNFPKKNCFDPRITA